VSEKTQNPPQEKNDELSKAELIVDEQLDELNQLIAELTARQVQRIPELDPSCIYE